MTPAPYSSMLCATVSVDAIDLRLCSGDSSASARVEVVPEFEKLKDLLLF